MKYQTLMATLLAAPLLANSAHAADLKGPDAVAALNGKSFQCTFNGGSFSWKFHKSDPKTGHLPYTVVLNGKTIKNAYQVQKNGKLRQADSNASRRVARNKDGSLTISGNGIPTARCVAG